MSKVNNSLPLEYSTEENDLKIFGFWVFLGAEIMLFGTLFASYFTLVDRTGSGPTGTEIFEITPVLLETFILLTSSFTIGLAIHAMRLGSKKAHDALEHIYYETVDYTKIAEIQKEIEDKILQLIHVLDITD